MLALIFCRQSTNCCLLLLPPPCLLGSTQQQQLQRQSEADLCVYVGKLNITTCARANIFQHPLNNFIIWIVSNSIFFCKNFARKLNFFFTMAINLFFNFSTNLYGLKCNKLFLKKNLILTIFLSNFNEILGTRFKRFLTKLYNKSASWRSFFKMKSVKKAFL